MELKLTHKLRDAFHNSYKYSPFYILHYHNFFFHSTITSTFIFYLSLLNHKIYLNINVQIKSVLLTFNCKL